MPDLEKAEIPVAMKKGYRELELLRLEHNTRGAQAVADALDSLGITQEEWDYQWSLPANKRTRRVEVHLAPFRAWQKTWHNPRSMAVCEVIAPLKDAHVAAEAKRLGIAVKDVDIVAIKQPLKDSTLYDSEIEAVE